MALFYSSYPVSRETEAAKCNSAIINVIILTCASPTVTCQNVFWEKGIKWWCGVYVPTCVYLLTDGVRTGHSGVRSGGEKGSMTGSRSWRGTYEERDTKEKTQREMRRQRGKRTQDGRQQTRDFMTTVWTWHTNIFAESRIHFFFPAPYVKTNGLETHAGWLSFYRHWWCANPKSNP